MAYPYGLDIDSFCREKCPKERRARCQPSYRRKITTETSLFIDARPADGCEHPEVVAIAKSVEVAVKKAREEAGRLRAVYFKN